MSKCFVPVPLEKALGKSHSEYANRWLRLERLISLAYKKIITESRSPQDSIGPKYRAESCISLASKDCPDLFASRVGPNMRFHHHGVSVGYFLKRFTLGTGSCVFDPTGDSVRKSVSL